MSPGAGLTRLNIIVENLPVNVKDASRIVTSCNVNDAREEVAASPRRGMKPRAVRSDTSTSLMASMRQSESKTVDTAEPRPLMEMSVTVTPTSRTSAAISLITR